MERLTQPVAAGGNGFGLFLRVWDAVDLPLIATGCNHGAPWSRMGPQPALALVQLAQGEIAMAAASIRDALERPLRAPSKERPPDTELQRAPILEAQVEIEIATGNLGRGRSAAEELELVAARFQSKALVAGATLARGRVRLAEGDATGAEQSFSDAARLWNDVGAPYEVALARMGLAEALRASGGEHQANLELQAARTVLERIAQVAGPDGTDEHPASELSLRREGDYWSMVFEGRTVRVRDLKGMRYLARLLAQPGRDLHVLDLVAAENPAAAPAESGPAAEPSRRALGDAGEILDARAKSAYRRRLAEIEDDIEQARTLGDTGRAAQADTKREFLVQELSRAIGLSGRDRRAASPACVVGPLSHRRSVAAPGLHGVPLSAAAARPSSRAESTSGGPLRPPDVCGPTFWVWR